VLFKKLKGGRFSGDTV